MTATVRLHIRRAGRSGRTVLAVSLALAAALAAGSAASAGPDAASSMGGAGGLDGATGDAPFEGRVAAYLLAPDAGVAGLIFDDGRQVSVPPHLGPRLAALIQPGQQARIGARRDEPRGPGGARSITAVASGQTLADGSRDEPRPTPRAAGGGLQRLQAGGTIRLRLHGPRGETNGLLLDTGTQVFFPPHVAHEAGTWLQFGTAIDVEGYGSRSSFGTVLQATRLVGPGGKAVNVYGAADDPKARSVDTKASRRDP